MRSVISVGFWGFITVGLVNTVSVTSIPIAQGSYGSMSESPLPDRRNEQSKALTGRSRPQSAQGLPQDSDKPNLRVVLGVRPCWVKLSPDYSSQALDQLYVEQLFCRR